ncbi:hypothetical protein N2W54_005557 [Lotmaria passim]
MLRLIARRGLHSSRPLRADRSFHEVTSLPRGMHRFEPSSTSPVASTFASQHDTTVRSSCANLSDQDVTQATTRGTAPPPLLRFTAPSSTHTQAAGGVPSSSHPLPPWPVDEIEFNAAVEDGGQSARIAWEGSKNSACWSVLLPPQHRSSSSSNRHNNEANGDAKSGAPTVADRWIKTVPLTPDVMKRLAVEEERAAAQAALAVGGWICLGCWTPQGIDAATRSHSCFSEGNTDVTVEEVFPRTVCSVCHSLRHDAQTWPLIAAFRAMEDPQRWICAQCGEVNRLPKTRSGNDDGVDSKPDNGKTSGGSEKEGLACRCCGGTTRAMLPSQSGHFLPQHSPSSVPIRPSVHDEVATEPLGHIVVTRNRTTRWRCSDCGEINSLQLTQCRNCARERFNLSVRCPYCETPRQLSNALVRSAGQTAGTADESAAASPPEASVSARLPVYSSLNCYQPGSTQLSCLQCGGPLHGGAVCSFTYGTAPWWCACGVVNPTHAYSCYRCRLPRTVGDPALLKALLQEAVARVREGDAPDAWWDFATCTSWFCDSCDGINRAAYQVVAERDEAAFDTTSQSSVSPHAAASSKRKQRVWVDAGDLKCKHCEAPWHHQLLHGGEWWRCACHAVNKRKAMTCTSCGLPALDGVQAFVLSAWSKGDWWCFACGTHCYRDRMRCRCGADRPTLG